MPFFHVRRRCVAESMSSLMLRMRCSPCSFIVARLISGDYSRPSSLPWGHHSRYGQSENGCRTSLLQGSGARAQSRAIRHYIIYQQNAKLVNPQALARSVRATCAIPVFLMRKHQARWTGLVRIRRYAPYFRCSFRAKGRAISRADCSRARAGDRREAVWGLQRQRETVPPRA